MELGIIKTLERKTPIVTVEPDRHTALRNVADNLSRRLYDQATIELLTEALHRLVTLAYDADAAGFVNVDGITGRLLIPAPWGRAGRSRWGLYPSEGDTLRLILRGRQTTGKALFVYDRGRRSWLLNLRDYPNASNALTCLKDHPISDEEFRLAYKKAMGKTVLR